MCVAGLYFVFLFLEDVIVAYYSTDAASQNQDVNLKAAYDIFHKNIDKSLNVEDIKLNSNKDNLYNIFNISITTSRKQLRKWQSQRVTRKQYEIINLLWRKTKIIMDEDSIYTTNPSYRQNFTRALSRRSQTNPIISTITSTLQTTTPSNIEFYYLDDSAVPANFDKCSYPNCKQSSVNSNLKFTRVTSKPAFFIFHIKSPYEKLQLKKSNKLLSQYPKLNNDQMKPISHTGSIVERKQVIMQDSTFNLPFKNELHQAHGARDDHFFNDELLINKRNKYSSPSIDNYNFSSNRYVHKLSSIAPRYSTNYDKIRFFELYDRNTRTPNIKNVYIPPIDYNDEFQLNNDKKILLEHVDHGTHDHKQAKLSKKHITENQNVTKEYSGKINKITTKSSFQSSKVLLKNQSNVSNATYINLTGSISSNNKEFENISKNASWSEYPFTAVYIYEPSKVHCDAAGISAYWLVASGSCLSRVHKNPKGFGRSAFVAYCGEQWWNPERMAYVKYSLVHPKYHSRDRTRKHLFNIGVIQVVTSMMSACSGWAPVPLMSHQFAPEPHGSWVSAVGWGLDRFDTRYDATDLPRTPLMVYKGLVYFDSCPGNIGYSKAKRLYEGGGVKNVHCMSLPPYSGEENDPVHGGLLLAGGKLIALYLQEERRPWGEQSAQYTGIWRLIPWVMDVANEPGEQDAFSFDI